MFVWVCLIQNPGPQCLEFASEFGLVHYGDTVLNMGDPSQSSAESMMHIMMYDDVCTSGVR